MEGSLLTVVAEWFPIMCVAYLGCHQMAEKRLLSAFLAIVAIVIMYWFWSSVGLYWYVCT